MSQLDWSDLRHALAVGELGSVAAAARRLGVNATTVQRRLDALELALWASPRVLPRPVAPPPVAAPPPTDGEAAGGKGARGRGSTPGGRGQAGAAGGAAGAAGAASRALVPCPGVPGAWSVMVLVS